MRRALAAVAPWVGGVLVLLLAAGLVDVRVPWRPHESYTAEFVSARGLYVGDDVRVMGVPVGRVTAVEPRGDRVVVDFLVSRDQALPAEVDAVVMAPTLVAARFVQLSPPYTGGPVTEPGATIGLDHTAVPVEWNDVVTQLHRLSGTLGPRPGDEAGPAGRAVAAADDMLTGRGDDVRDTVRQLRSALQTVSDGRDDLFATVRNLEAFTAAMEGSGEQITTFNEVMAAVTVSVDRGRGEIGPALTELDAAVDEVRDFVRDNREVSTGTARTTAELVRVLAEQRDDIAQILHVAPTALSNLQGIYQPSQNAVISALALTNFANPMQFICSALAAAEETDVHTASEECVRLLGPTLSTLAVDYPPVGINPSRGVGALPHQLDYTHDHLRPDRAGVTDLLTEGVR
ncbi:mammalian cell entry protein [Dietzia lutea]|uniref:Mammalian cell entry protein n=2 Tax=Dietzia lutea TaxID=546160 RepID=A0A2S1R923_9ACTN|nr:mammalian cell entry protein [Dietzia lutea]